MPEPLQELIVGLSLGPWADGSLADMRAAADTCERARLDLLVAGYGAEPGLSGDPLTLVSALIGQTRDIGLGAVVPSAGWAPFNVARAFSALDLLSEGRSAWMVTPGEAVGDDEGRDRFREHLDAVFALFDSWEDDALVYDKPASVFVRREKVHRIAFTGRWFTVDGPLNSPRPPQGRPVVIQRLASYAEPPIAGTDIAIVSPPDIEAGAALRDRLIATGAAKVLVDLEFSLSTAPAQAGLGSLGYVGAPDGLAALMVRWQARGACDGFLLTPAATGDLDILAGAVIPSLQRQAVFKRAYGDGDLRTRLGLPRPANRFAAPAAA